MTKSLFVVRGAFRGVDSAFACSASQSAPQEGQYCAVETDTHGVTNRTFFARNDIKALENLMSTYRSVAVDMREDSRLLPKPTCAHAVELDHDMYRRAKSDEELAALEDLAKTTKTMLYRGDPDAKSFRQEAKDLGHQSCFETTKGKSFTEYRGGLRTSAGLCSDLTRVVCHNHEAQATLNRTEAGLDAVRDAVEAGVSVEHLDQIFRSSLDPSKEEPVSSCVHFTGYESTEKFRGAETLKEYDFVTIGGAIKYKPSNEVILVFRGGKSVGPAPVTADAASMDDVYQAVPAQEPQQSKELIEAAPRILDGMSALAASYM